MTEGKEGLITKTIRKIIEAIDEAIEGIDAKVIVDVAAVVSFAIGSLILGIGVNLESASAIVPGLALMLLAIGRLIHNCDGFD